MTGAGHSRGWAYIHEARPHVFGTKSNVQPQNHLAPSNAHRIVHHQHVNTGLPPHHLAHLMYGKNPLSVCRSLGKSVSLNGYVSYMRY
jgi:hypothetical protein